MNEKDLQIQELKAENAALKEQLAELQYMHDRLHDFETAEYIRDSEIKKELREENAKLKAERQTLLKRLQSMLSLLEESRV